ncbi:MAG: hypothetical protein H6R26_496, partial [Proteobacteria bacterium]|nr:hypothetical protein [Pseudomonadota bacterium]
MIVRSLNSAWLSLISVPLISIVAVLAVGAPLIVIDSAKETERQAQVIRTFVDSGLELGRGNPKSLQPLLASLPGPPPFSRLEISSKSGKLLEMRFEEATQDWLGRFLPAAEPLKLPLEKGGLVLTLVPSPALAAYRLTSAAYLVLPVLLAVVLGIPLIARVLERRVQAGRIDDQRWAHALPSETLAERREEPPSPLRGPPGGKDLVDFLPTALLRCDQGGRIVYMNGAARVLLGQAAQSGEELLFLDLITPWERKRVAAVLSRDYFQGERSTIETQALVGRGAILPVNIDITAWPDASGELILAMRDASGIRVIQDHLDSRTRLLDCISHGAAILSPHHNGTLLYCNQAFGKMLQLPADNDRPGVLLERIGALSDSAAEKLRTATAQLSSARMRLSVQDGNGQTRRLELQVSPVALGHTGETALVCETQDRTEELVFRLGAEQDLALQKTILDGMSVGLCIADETGKVLEANPQLTK